MHTPYALVSYAAWIFILNFMVLGTWSVVKNVVHIVVHNVLIFVKTGFLRIFLGKTVSLIFMKFSGFVYHVKRYMCANFYYQMTLITCQNETLKMAFRNYWQTHFLNTSKTTSPALLTPWAGTAGILLLINSTPGSLGRKCCSVKKLKWAAGACQCPNFC